MRKKALASHSPLGALCHAPVPLFGPEALESPPGNPCCDSSNKRPHQGSGARYHVQPSGRCRAAAEVGGGSLDAVRVGHER